jgi:hypothetical protein
MVRNHPSFLILIRPFVVGVLAVICSGHCLSQSVEDEPAAVVELGASLSRSLTEDKSSAGPTAAIEFTPIEDRLEIEVGVTSLLGDHSTESSADLLFKKPWTLSATKEFMLGIGPEWIHTSAYGVTTNAVGVEVAPDFMFWPSGKHRFGWYLEPSYEYKFGSGHEHSISLTVGLLIGVHRTRPTREAQHEAAAEKSSTPKENDHTEPRLPEW